MGSYEKCIASASPAKLCKRGYCSAKEKYTVYPSAYANNYAVKVCKGESPDAKGVVRRDAGYMRRSSGRKSSLRRWNKEQWVNVCEKGDGPGGYKVCGSGQGIKRRKKYPYCRPYYKQSGTTVKTARELSPTQLKKMCRAKRSLTPGAKGKPTRVYISKSLSPRRSPKTAYIPIPQAVKRDAEKGIKLMDLGFAGGTKTGWDRAKQLATRKYIDPYSLSVMRAWFARHGPDAKTGGTSYPGYRRWIKEGKPLDVGKNDLRGAVSWLIWGGDSAYKWLKTEKIRRILAEYYPNKKASSCKNKL